jgi:hypothetical protein
MDLKIAKLFYTKTPMWATPSGWMGVLFPLPPESNQYQEILTRRLGKTSHNRIRMLYKFCDAANVTVKSSHKEMTKNTAERSPKTAITFN